MAIALTFLLALLFAVSGVSKFRSRTVFRAALRDIVPSGAVRSLAIGVPLLELVIATWLLAGHAPSGAMGAALATLVVFSGALVQMVRLGVPSCSCFGEGTDTSPRIGLARNAALIAAILAVLGGADTARWTGSLSADVVAYVTVACAASLLWLTTTSLASNHELLFKRIGDQ